MKRNNIIVIKNNYCKSENREKNERKNKFIQLNLLLKRSREKKQ